MSKILKEVVGSARKDVGLAINEAGLNWNCALHPLVTMSKEQLIAHECPQDLADSLTNSASKTVNRFATVRQDTGHILGVVGNTYKPLQNRDAFKFFQGFLDSGEVELDSIGSMFHGAKVVINAKLNRDDIDMGNGDKIQKFLMISNAHNGSSSLRVGFIPRRLTCFNQLPMLHKSKESALIRFRHSENIEVNLSNVRATIDAVDATFNATAIQYKALLNYGINKADIRKHLKIILEVKEEIEDKDLPAQTQKKLDELYNLCFNSPGQDGKSAYSILNSVTYYTSHRYGRNEENRLDALNFGAGARLNERAMSYLVKLAS